MTIERTINRNLLKHAAGTAMFCPTCERCLDYRKTVIISMGPRERVVCSTCFDKLCYDLGPKLLENRAINILDGRTA